MTSSDTSHEATRGSLAAPLRVLLVEDSEVDAELMLRGLRAHADVVSVVHVEDGDAALADLAEHLDTALVLLDLNLPGTDGRAVLTTMKADPMLRPIRVLVLTGSSHPSDVEFCSRNGADGYLCKPLDRATLRQLVQNVLDFLLQGRPVPMPPAR